jgi:hypothetical protein
MSVPVVGLTLGEGVYCVGMGAGGWGAALKANLIVMYLFYSPLKNMIGKKISFSALPQ